MLDVMTVITSSIINFFTYTKQSMLLLREAIQSSFYMGTVQP